MLWENLREEEFYEAIERSNKVCVVPFGCIEKHGQHLPVGTDAQTAYYIAKEATKLEDVVVFPPLYFGDVLGLYMWKGTIAFSSELLQKMLTELCAEIARNGFKKILLLNGHGGNVALISNFLRSVAKDKKDYVVVSRNEFSYNHFDLVRDIDNGESFPELSESDIEYLREAVEGNYIYGHGDILETAILNVINPESVDMSKADSEDGTDQHITDDFRKFGMPGNFWLTDFPNSLSGEKLERANANIGKALLRKRIAMQAEACRILKQDDRVLEWQQDWCNKW